MKNKIMTITMLLAITAFSTVTSKATLILGDRTGSGLTSETVCTQKADETTKVDNGVIVSLTGVIVSFTGVIVSIFDGKSDVDVNCGIILSD